MTEEQARDVAMKLAWERWEDGWTIQEQYDTVWHAALEYANRWTYCDDALPKLYGSYLVQDEYGDMEVMKCGDDRDFELMATHFVAWRPLPKAAEIAK